MYCMHDGAMAGREQFFCCVFWTDWEACAGGRVGGRSVGRAVQLGWATQYLLGWVGSVGWAAGPVLALALRSGGCHESLETQAETSGETGGKLECFLVAAWRRLDYHSLPLTTVTRKLDGGVWSCLDLGPLLSLHYSPHRYM